MKIHVTFCGGWGYGPRFKRVKAVLEANISGIEITGAPTKDTSGAFEVTNVDTGKVYWSKLGGQGYLDTNKEALEKVVEAIKADA